MSPLGIPAPWSPNPLACGFGGFLVLLTALALFAIARPERTVVRLATTALAVFTLLLCPVVLSMQTGLDRAMQRGTVADMRSVATAIEEYARDHHGPPRLPPPPAGEIDDGLRLLPSSRARPRPIAAIQSDLEPAYIKRLPLTDEWGSPLYYDSDGTRFAILAPAEGGTMEPWTWTRGGAGRNRREDLIYVDEGFFKY